MALASSSRSSLLGVSAVQRAQARKGRRYADLFILLAITVLLSVIHTRSANSDRMDPITAGVRTITVPVVNAVSNSWEWSGSQVSWIFRGHGVDAENRK